MEVGGLGLPLSHSRVLSHSTRGRAYGKKIGRIRHASVYLTSLCEVAAGGSADGGFC